MKTLFSSNFFGILAVTAIILSFFLPNLLRGKIPIPADALLNLYHPYRDLQIENFQPGRFPAKNTLITDPILQTYPWRYLIIKNLKEGNIPLWNPYSFSGQPLLANFQSSAFQAGNIFFLFLPFNIAWAINIILPLILSGVFTYLFLSYIKIRGKHPSLESKIFASAALPFTGFFVSWMEWGTVVTAVMWLPLLLTAIEKIFKKVSIFWILILIIAVSQTLFSGHLQSAIYVLLAAILYSIFKLLGTGNSKTLMLIALAIFLGMMLTSLQTLPSMEFSKLSARTTDQKYDPQRQDWFIPPQHIIHLIAPDFFGNPATGNYWGIWNYGEFISFIGIVPLSFALFALGKIKEDKTILYLSSLLFLSILFGFKNPISEILYRLEIPIISSMQPSRIIFLMMFSLICLSGLGLHLFQKEKLFIKKIIPIVIILLLQLLLIYLTVFQSQIFPIVSNINVQHVSLRNLIVPVLTSFLLFFLIILNTFNLKKSLFLILIIALTFFELFRFASKFLPFSKTTIIFPSTKAINYLQNQSKPFRIMTTDRRIMHPNISGVYAIESVDGYDPLYLKTYANFVSAWQSEKGIVSDASFNRIITPQKINLNYLNLLNVKYLLTFDNIDSKEFSKVFEEGETKIYEYRNANPRAFFVKRVLKFENPGQELSYISSVNFKPKEHATSSQFEYTAENINSNVKITKYSDQEIILTASADETSPLIVSNTNYPGWKTYVDGKEEKISTANYMLQLVMVPKGDHEIKLRYELNSLKNGLLLMSAGLLGSFLLIIHIWRSKYQ